MKKIAIIALLIGSFTVNAQDKEIKSKRVSKFTIEQRAEIHTKRLVLALDLDENQKQKIYDISLRKVKEADALRNNKEKRSELTDKERFDKKNQMLDKQIAYKKEMKEILNKEQYEKFERNMLEKRSKRGGLEMRKEKRVRE